MMTGSVAPLAVWSYPLLGEEFQVNTTTENHQQLPGAGMDANGNFVVVFQNHLPVTNANVSAQRYNAAGEPLGDEFQVNTTAFSGGTFPAVAMDDDGDFVVTWMDFGDDGSGYGVFARMYNAAGSALGGNFPVNTTTAGAQRRPDIAIDADGDFVIAWENQPTGEKRSIKARAFNALGVPQSGEIDVSTNGEIDHTWPQVAMDDAGNFVVAWASGNVGANQDVVFRLFDADGDPLTAPVQANVTTKMDHASGVLNNLGVAMDADGDLVVTWAADNLSGPGVVGAAVGVVGRLYDADGDAKGGTFIIDDQSAALLSKPEVAMTKSGDFTVAYEGSDGSGLGIKVQRFYANGDPKGATFVANTTTSSQQTRPTIAVDDDGNAIVAWEASGGLDGDLDGVFARRLSGGGIQPTMDFNNSFSGDIGFRNTISGSNILWFMDNLSQSEVGAITRVKNQAWQVAGAGDFNRDGNADILWRNAETGQNIIWFMNGFDPNPAVIPNAGTDWFVVGVGDLDRDGQADIVWRNSVTGAIYGWLMDGSTRKQLKGIRTVSLDWVIEALADFNDDGRVDLLFRHVTSGKNRVWLMNGFDSVSLAIPTVANLDWTMAGAGDFNQDGTADILWRNITTGRNIIWQMENGAVAVKHNLNTVSDTGWKVVTARDFNRDDNADLLWRHSTSGRLVIWQIEDLKRTAIASFGSIASSWRIFDEN
jgi:hypothetical protein